MASVVKSVSNLCMRACFPSGRACSALQGLSRVILPLTSLSHLVLLWNGYSMMSVSREINLNIRNSLIQLEIHVRAAGDSVRSVSSCQKYVV